MAQAVYKVVEGGTHRYVLVYLCSRVVVETGAIAYKLADLAARDRIVIAEVGVVVGIARLGLAGLRVGATARVAGHDVFTGQTAYV